jgi:hypothetical protein
MMKMLGLADDKHEQTLKRIEDHIEGRVAHANDERTTLDHYAGI